MACGVTLKRPHEYDAYMSPEAGGGKRPRTTSAHCSPFRPTFGTAMAASLSSATNNNNSSHNSGVDFGRSQADSPFAQVASAKLSSEQLESYLIAEVRYLKRRKLLPKRHGNGQQTSSADHEDHRSSYRVPNSPNHSASDSDGEGGGPSTREVGNSSDGARSGMQAGNAKQPWFERPQFSLRQVQLICERLLKEQEIRLRYEYETVLNQRLDEQREQFVQFTQDQIERRFVNNHDISYLS